MNTNMVKDIVKGIGKGLLTCAGIVTLGALSVMTTAIEQEQKEAYGENFKEVMGAINNSNMTGYQQKSLIEKLVTIDLTTDQVSMIKTICETDMNGYDKFTTIVKIIEK